VRPPVCWICGESPRDDSCSWFTAVRFGSEAEEEVRREPERAGWVGHPPEVEWFCAEHAPLAEEHAHLHWRTALTRLQEHQK
jgi:hypothetical protein